MSVTVINPISKIITVGSIGNTSAVDAVSSRLISTGSYLESLITVSAAGVSTINSHSGALVLTGAGNVTVSINGQIFTISGNTGNLVSSSQTGIFITTGQTGSFGGPVNTGTLTGAFYPLGSNPSGFVTTGQTGVFGGSSNTGILTGIFYPLNLNPSGYLTGFNSGLYTLNSLTGSFIITTQTGAFSDIGYVSGISGTLNNKISSTGSTLLALIQAASAGVSALNGQSGTLTLTGKGNVSVIIQGQTFNISGDTGIYSSFVLTGNTGSFITNGQTGQFAPAGLTGNFITTSQTGNFVVTSKTGIFVDNGMTGAFITSSQTGQFYSNSNPSGFIRSTQTGNFADIGYVSGISGVIDSRLNSTGSSLLTLIQASNAGVSSINSKSGSLTFTGAGNVNISINGQAFTVSGDTGAYGNFLLQTSTGNFVSYDYLKNTGYWGSTGISNQKFNNNLIIFRGNDTESSTVGYDNIVPSQGINFSRAWLGTTTGLEGGIYGFSTPNWGGGLVFQTKFGDGNQTGSGTVSLIIQSDQKVSVGSGLASERLHVFGNIRTESGFFSGNSNISNLFYPLLGNPSGFVTGSVIRPSDTGNFVLTSQTGLFAQASLTGNFITANLTGNFVDNGKTGQFAPAGLTGNFITTGQTGIFINNGMTGSFITSGQTGVFLTTRSRSLYLENPVAGDRIAMFKVENQVTLRRVTSVVYTTGSSPSTTYQLTQATTRNGNSGIILNSSVETGTTTGTLYTSFNNSIITGGNYVFFECLANSNTNNISITLDY